METITETKEIWTLPAPAKTDDITTGYHLTSGQQDVFMQAGITSSWHTSYVDLTFANIGDIKQKLVNFRDRNNTERGEKAVVTRTLKELNESLEKAYKWENRNRTQQIAKAKNLVETKGFEWEYSTIDWEFERSSWKWEIRAKISGADFSRDLMNYHYDTVRVSVETNVDEQGATIEYVTRGGRFATLVQAQQFAVAKALRQYEEYKQHRIELTEQAQEMLEREGLL